MNPIVQGQAINVLAPITTAGAAVAIPLTETATATILGPDGSTVLLGGISCLSSAPGADWPNGIVAVPLTGSQATGLQLGEVIVRVVLTTLALTRLFQAEVRAPGGGQSLLFTKADIIASMRRDRLITALASFFQSSSLNDEYIWEKIVQAEASVARLLRVPLVPTEFYPDTPTSDQIAGLGGAPYGIDPAYDYDPDFFQGEKWGYIRTRNKPLIAVRSIKFAYPSPTMTVFQVPSEWIRIDRKAGDIRLVPATQTFSAPLNAFLMQALGGGRTIPFMISVQYQAGLSNAFDSWPDVVDLVKKTAVVSMAEDNLVPKSGSISADGLTESISADLEAYRGVIDRLMYGPKGANGGLWTAIHGVQTVVL